MRITQDDFVEALAGLVIGAIFMAVGIFIGRGQGRAQAPLERPNGRYVWMEQVQPPPGPQPKLYRYPDGYVGPIPTPTNSESRDHNAD